VLVISADAQKGNVGLHININSNNPFLNPKPTSPAPMPSPHSASIRPASTNPFLTSFEQELRNKPQVAGNTMESQTTTSLAPPAIGEDAKELFVSLTGPIATSKCAHCLKFWRGAWDIILRYQSNEPPFPFHSIPHSAPPPQPRLS
jgi:hypothetical protein